MKDDLLARVYRTLFEAANDPERPERALLSKDVAARIDVDVEAAAHALTQLHGAGLVTYLDGGPAFPIPWVLADKAPAAVHTVSVVIAEWLRWQGSDDVWRGPIHLPDVANLVENGAPFSPWEPAEPSERPGSVDAERLVDVALLPFVVSAEGRANVAREIVGLLDPDVVRLDGPRYCHAKGSIVLAPGSHVCAADAPLYAGLRENRSGTLDELDTVLARYGDARAFLDDSSHAGQDRAWVADVRESLKDIPRLVREVRALRAAPEREASVTEFADALREGRPPGHPAARAADRLEELHAEGRLPSGSVGDDTLYRDAAEALEAMGPHHGEDWGRALTVQRALERLPWLVGRADHLNGEVERLCKVADEAGIPVLRDALHDAGVALTRLLGRDADLYELDAVRARDAVAAALGGMPHAAPLPSPHHDAPREARRAVARAEGVAREILADLVSIPGWGRAEPVSRLAERLRLETADVVAAARGLLLLPDDRPDPDYLAATKLGLFGLRDSGTRSGIAWPLVADSHAHRLPPPAPDDEAARFGEAFADRVLDAAQDVHDAFFSASRASVDAGKFAPGGIVRGTPPLAQVGEGGDGCILPRSSYRVDRIRVADVREDDVVYLGPPHEGAGPIGYARAMSDVSVSSNGVEGRFSVAHGSRDDVVRYAWRNARDLVDVQRQARVAFDGVHIEIHNPAPGSVSESVAERVRRLGFGGDGDAVPAR